MSKNCSHCNQPITSKSAKKFCNSSCAASYNNKGVRRHGKGPNQCKICAKPTKRHYNKYCSRSCMAIGLTKHTDEDRKRLNRESYARYYAKKKNQTPDDADLNIIKEFYLNCPEGYEVDHIYPISKGGLHHQDNLQYLTPTENKIKGNKIL